MIEQLSEQGYRRFTAGTALENTPSVKLLRSLGFSQIGEEQVSFYKDEDGDTKHESTKLCVVKIKGDGWKIIPMSADGLDYYD